MEFQHAAHASMTSKPISDLYSEKTVPKSIFTVGCHRHFALHLSLWSCPGAINVFSSLIKSIVQPWFEVQKSSPFNRQMAQGRFRVNQRHRSQCLSMGLRAGGWSRFTRWLCNVQTAGRLILGFTSAAVLPQHN